MTRMIPITDFDAPELDVYARMKEIQLLNRHEPEKGLFLAESPLVIGRALNAGYVPVSILVEESQIASGMEDRAENDPAVRTEPPALEIIKRCGDVPVFTAPFQVLTKLTGFALTRGMLCVMRRRPLPTLSEICVGAKTIAILENVMNPTNVGAIIRSAAALNMDGVVLAGNCSNPLYRRAARVSMGTVFQIPWTILDSTVAWPAEGVRKLKDMGFRTVAMALSEQSVSINDPNLLAEERLAVILGSEGPGLLPETISACDYTVKIPMSHGVDSLNVAAASAVMFWQLGQRSDF